jgi:hypothetical protein
MIHPPMILGACPFCEHVNPADSKFCNVCGGALHLAHCPRCGAVNDVTATACYQCHDPFPGRKPGAPEPDQPAPQASKPLPLPKSRLAVGAAILVVVSISGYYGYSKRWLIDPSQPPAAGNDAIRPDNRTDAGVALGEAAIRVTHTARADESAGPVGSAFAKREIPVPNAKPAPAGPSRSDSEPAGSRKSKLAATPATQAKAGSTARSGERGLPGDQACTEPVAALGLCTFRPGEKKDTEKASPEPAEIARPQSVVLGKTAGQESPGGQACTTAAAALGLCTPQLTQEGR